MTPRERIAHARNVTATIDRGLWDAVMHLQQVGQVSNGAGIYADISQFKSALADTARAIATAKALIDMTEWPTEQDYDNAQA